MFNRQISKRLNETHSTRRERDLEQDRIVGRINQTEEDREERSYRFSSEELMNSKKGNNTRNAAGFEPSSKSKPASSSSRGARDTVEDDYFPDRSRNEMQLEEFDVDDSATTVQYPRQAYYPSSPEALLEEYSEQLLNEDVRLSDQSQQRLPVPMSPQVSTAPFRVSSSSASENQQRLSRKSNFEQQQPGRRSSKGLAPPRPPEPIAEEDNSDEDIMTEDPLRLEPSSNMGQNNTSSAQILSSSRLPSRSNSRSSRRNSSYFFNPNPPSAPSLETPHQNASDAASVSGTAATNSVTNSTERDHRGSINYIQSTSHNRLNANNNSAPPPSNNFGAREVIPLPIEIPDTVTDTDAFRRYLSVRRGAVFPTTHDERSTIESLGGGGRNINTSQHLAPNRSATQMSPPSFVNSSSSLQPLRQQPPDSSPPSPAPQGCPSSYNNNDSSHRRTASLSHAIMTLALLSASAAQLRFVIAYSHAHAYPTLNYFLICSCIIIEILVGIGFVVLARFDFTEAFQDKLHSYLIFGLFVVTVANVIIAAFALDDHICEILMKRTVQNSVINNAINNGMDGQQMQQPFDPNNAPFPLN